MPKQPQLPQGGRVWAGIDAGKMVHHLAVADDEGQVVWSVTVPNDQPAITQMITTVTGQGRQVSWAVDLTSSPARLLLALLLAAGQDVVYVPGRTVNRMSGAFAGEAKTDTKDAVTIAQTARMRRDFTPARPPQELVAELAMLTAHRADLSADWVRGISRLRDLLTSIFPALERAFDYSTRPALILVARYQTPAAIRRAGRARLETCLRAHGARKVTQMAAAALAAAQSQTITLPGQDTAAKLIAQIASDLLNLDRRITGLDTGIAATFARHPQAQIITSLPGISPQLGTEFIIAAGDLSTFRDPGHLAAYAGLAPVPRDSGRITGNLHRPQRYHRRLRRVFYLAALSSLRTSGPSRDYYLKKRSEGRRHQQALMALARRLVDVLWALLRDNRTFTMAVPAT